MSGTFEPAAIVLLAGGLATRLPGKLFLAIDGEPLLARIVRRLEIAERALVVVTSAALEADVRATIAALAPGAHVIVDAEPGLGPLPALLAAAAHIEARGVSWFVALAADMPDVDASLIERLEDARANEESNMAEAFSAVGADDRLQPLATLYRARAVASAGTLLLERGERRLHALLDRLRTVDVAVDAKLLVNLNTPLRSARASPGA